MVDGADQGPSPEVGDDAEDDPLALAPICDEAEFDEAVAEMVADEAPRLFAVVQVYGERADGWIAAWGLAFEDRAELVGTSGQTRMRLNSPERAVHLFGLRPNVTARLAWIDHGPALG